MAPDPQPTSKKWIFSAYSSCLSYLIIWKEILYNYYIKENFYWKVPKVLLFKVKDIKAVEA